MTSFNRAPLARGNKEVVHRPFMCATRMYLCVFIILSPFHNLDFSAMKLTHKVQKHLLSFTGLATFFGVNGTL